MYCVLWGTLLLDYDHEEDAKNSLSPRLVVEIVGVSEWDGRGRANSYPGGFLLVSHTGATYYVSVSSQIERDEWMLHLRRGLECVFANPEVAPFKPSKIVQQRPPPAGNHLCPKTHNQLSSYGTYLCKSCGRGFYAAEHVMEQTVIIQCGSTELEKVCVDCKVSQTVVMWLKTMNYVHALDLHEMTPMVAKDVSKFKASFRLRRRLSQRLDMAAELYDAGNLTAEEFEELRIVDHAYRRELMFDECEKLKHAIEAFGEDMQTIINVLMDNSLYSRGGRNAYFNIIIRILEIADFAPDLVDFYFPQLYSVYLQQSAGRSFDCLIQIDTLQQALLVLSQKYPSFAMKLAWNLMATIGDYDEKKVLQTQYASAVALLFQLEMVVSGVISSIADVPTSKTLAKILHPAAHQQQEIAYEISILFLVRRKLQEAYDDEELARMQRNLDLYGKSHPDTIDLITKTLPDGREVVEKLNRSFPKPSSFPGTNVDCSCVELLYQLGVGQCNRSSSKAQLDDNNSEEDSSIHSKASDNHSNATTDSMLLSHWNGFSEQLDFMDRLNDLVESLRFIDRPARTETFRKELVKWNKHMLRQLKLSAGIKNERTSTLSGTHAHPTIDINTNGHVTHNNMDHSTHSTHSSTSGNKATTQHPIFTLGWDPVMIAGEPHYRMTKIITDECRVFRTKARAPSLVMVEVMRDDIYQQYKAHGTLLQIIYPEMFPNKNSHPVTSPTSSEAQPDEYSLTGFDGEEGGNHGAKTKVHKTPTKKTANIAKAVPHSVVSNRQKADSFDQTSNSIPVAPINSQQSPEINVSKHSFETVSQNIRDVDQLLVDSSLRNAMVAEMQKADHSNQQQNREVLSPDAIAIAVGEGDAEISTYSERPLDHTADNTPNNSGKLKSNPSFHLPKWRRNSSFLPANRLSTSTEGILKSSQVNNPLPNSSNSNQEVASSPQNRQSRHLSTNIRNSIAVSGKNRMSVSVSSPALMANIHGNFEDDGSDTTYASTVDFEHPDQTAVLSSAQRLLNEGLIDQREYEQLLQSDQQYRDEAAREEANVTRTKVESAFGETFATKRERLIGEKLDLLEQFNEDGMISLEDDCWPIYDLKAFIVKTNDDLRQEICCLQLMKICKEIFDHFGLSDMLFLKPYRIICTGNNTGIVEVLPDAISLDALKRTPGFTTLTNYFNKTYDASPEQLMKAKINFMKSLAAYSLFSYILLIKDRHNGNLLIDSEGHILHIDFGFLLSIAPGGSFSVETAPFKLSDEMVELLGGLDSPLFGDFVTAFTKGFITLQANCENILAAISVLSQNSTFPCFQGKPVQQILERLRSRFRTELGVNDAVKHCLDLITNSYGHYGTRQYDTFQYYTNGILP